MQEVIDRDGWAAGNVVDFVISGSSASKWVRKLLAEGRYKLMATDVHAPDSLEQRLDGLQLVAEEFGQERLDALTITAPRSLILNS